MKLLLLVTRFTLVVLRHAKLTVAAGKQTPAC